MNHRKFRHHISRETRIKPSTFSGCVIHRQSPPSTPQLATRCHEGRIDDLRHCLHVVSIWGKQKD